MWSLFRAANAEGMHDDLYICLVASLLLLPAHLSHAQKPADTHKSLFSALKQTTQM